MSGQRCYWEAGGWAGTAAACQPAWRRDHGLDAEPWLRERVAELEAENEAENEVLAAQLAARDAQLQAAQARLAVLAGEFRRRLGKDSATSSKPPSSDSPYTKRPKDRHPAWLNSYKQACLWK